MLKWPSHSRPENNSPFLKEMCTFISMTLDKWHILKLYLFLHLFVLQFYFKTLSSKLRNKQEAEHTPKTQGRKGSPCGESPEATHCGAAAVHLGAVFLRVPEVASD